MTALASLKAELADLKKSIAQMLGSKKVRAEGETKPESEGEETDTEETDTVEGEETDTEETDTVEGEGEEGEETEPATEEEKEEAKAALKTLKGFTASLDKSVAKIKAELKAENEKNFKAAVIKEAAAQTLKASGKPLAKHSDTPSGDKKTEAKGLARVKAGIQAKRK